MTDEQFASVAKAFEADLKDRGLRMALEIFLETPRGFKAPAVRIRPEEIDGAIRAVIEGVARHWGTTAKEVLSMDCLVHPAPTARHEAMTRIKACGYTNEFVAGIWGCDPSTVSDGRKSFRRRFPWKADEIEAPAERRGPRLARGGERRAA